MVGAAPDQTDGVPNVQPQFVEGGRFTAGLSVKYNPSDLIAAPKWQSLATGLEVGERFHSAPVVRLADALPMQLGHAAQSGARWYIYAFAPAANPISVLSTLCEFLQNDPTSPVNTYRRDGDDIDTMIDLRAVFQQGFRDMVYEDLPALLHPAKGKYGLTDYEKAFCADPTNGQDIFDMRGIDRKNGCMVVVRPDQYVANILPLDVCEDLTIFFKPILLSAT